jgi:uncharacterized protein (TIGR02246 family)
MGIVLLLLAAVAGLAAGPEDDIKRLLARQQQDWNRGDIQAFMQAYDKADVAFVGTTVDRGWDKILARYLGKYPTRAAMGDLDFSGIQVRMLGPEFASVIGRFHLKRDKAAGGNATGLFTLLLHKTPAGWRIILDHTS